MSGDRARASTRAGELDGNFGALDNLGSVPAHEPSAHSSDKSATEKDVNGNDLGESHAEGVNAIICPEEFGGETNEGVADEDHQGDVAGFCETRARGIEAEERGESGFVELDGVDRKRFFLWSCEQTVADMLFVDVTLLGELDGEREVFGRNRGERLDADRDGLILQRGDLFVVDTNITPATAGEETADAAEGQTQRDAWRDRVDKADDWHAASKPIQDDGEGTEKKSAVENETLAFPDFQRFEKRKLGVEESGKKASAEQSGERKNERDVIEIAFANAVAFSARAGEEPTEEEAKEQQDWIRTDVRVQK